MKSAARTAATPRTEAGPEAGGSGAGDRPCAFRAPDSCAAAG